MMISSSWADSIILENRNYSEVSIKYLDHTGRWVDDIVEPRAVKELKLSKTQIKIDTDDVYVEYALYQNNVYAIYIDQKGGYWDLKRVTNKQELMPYVQRGMITK